MQKMFKENRVKRTLVAAAMLIGFGATAALAQMPPVGAPGAGEMGMHRPDPARMQVFFDKHMARLKTLLQLTSDQEGAWTAFKTAMMPPAAPPEMPKHEDLEKLTTPERIDRLHSLRVQHAQRMDAHEAAAKALYAALTPSQRKVFDLETLEFLSPQHRMGMQQPWMHRGEPHP